VPKRRAFRLAGPVSGAGAQALRAALTGMKGVREVALSGARLSVSYDLLQVTAAQIDAALRQAGFEPGGGWGQRLKRAWIHYTEDNEREHLAAGDGPCCNRPPRA
jgi:copper chaperone CopZ